MTTEGQMNERLNAMLNVESRHQYEVTARDIRRFAQAIGLSKLQMDEEGRFLAPPLFCQIFMFEDVPVEQLPGDGSPKELDVPVPARRVVGGESDFEILGRVREKDVITVMSKLQSVQTRQGRSGLLYLVVVATTFENQFGATVARETATYVKKD